MIDIVPVIQDDVRQGVPPDLSLIGTTTQIVPASLWKITEK